MDDRVDNGERCACVWLSRNAVLRDTNFYGIRANWHSKGGTQDNKPGNGGKGNDILIVVVESTDTEDEKEIRTWDGDRQNHMNASEDIAVVNGRS